MSMLSLGLFVEASYPTVYAETTLDPLLEQVKFTLQREASYRQIDYNNLSPSEEGYVQALRIAETNATLSAIYRYARYSEKTFQRKNEGRKVLVPLLDYTRLSYGLVEKRKNLESDADSGSVREFFDWKRSLWVTRMANYAAALRVLDQKIQAEKAQDRKHELKEERSRLLQDEPLLAVKIEMPFDPKDRRPSYSVIDDLYHRVPENSLTCLKPQKECLLYSVLHLNEKGLDELRQDLKEEQISVLHFGEQALAELFAPKNRQIYKGQPFVPLEVVEDVLSTFPGGCERYLSLLDEIRSESDNERLLHRIRDRIAVRLMEPALEETIATLKKELLHIPSRTFADFVPLPDLRQAVILSLSPSWGTLGAALDQSLLEEYQHSRFLRNIGDVAFVVAMGASLYFFPPAAGLAMFESPLVWTRIAAAGTHAYNMLRNAKRNVNMANLRALTGTGTYEWAALAESQYRMAVLFAYLDVFLPLRIGSSVRPALGRISQSLTRFATNPLAKEEVVEIAIGQSNPLRLLVRSLSRGGAMVRKISENTWQAWKEMGRLALLMGRGELRAAAAFLPTTTVSKAILNAGASSLIMIGTERISRGPLFYQEVGTYRNVLITLLIDGATGFYGLGSFTTLEKMVAIGGTVFSMSIVGQLLTGIRDPASLGLRAAGETAYCISLSPWKIVFADQLAGKVAALRPGWPLWNHGTYGAFFLGNNGIGNLLYSYGTKSLFEFSDPSNEHPWWHEAPDQEVAPDSSEPKLALRPQPELREYRR